MKITKDIYYVGVKDPEIRLFEGQYRVDGMTFNSYLIQDEKNTLLDTVDKSAVEEWLQNVENTLHGKSLDYLIISHLEPDHSAGILKLAEKYPTMKIVSNQKVFAFLPQFFEIPNLEERKIEVKEGDTLNLGKHTLKFIMAPMVHWPEVMMEYEETEKVLFSADAFGKFGSSMCEEPQEIMKDVLGKEESKEENWLSEARRYYINIVGKYGVQVQMLLKKVEGLDVHAICPLHGSFLTDNLGYYIEKYQIWSQYAVEEKGILITCASPHGHTLEAAQELKDNLLSRGVMNVKLMDLTREDVTEAVSQAFRYSTMVLASTTYNAELFPAMDQFLRLLKMKNYQNRKVALIENGTWAPMAAKHMQDILSTMKNLEIIEPIVTIHTALNQESSEKLKQLGDKL